MTATQVETRRWTWRRVLRWAAIADFGVMAFAGMILGDLEALAFAGLIGIAIFLLRFRGGLAGAVVLAVVTADAAAFMLPAFASNAAHREDLAAILIPASLGIISVTGLVAAIASIFRGSSATRLAGLIPQIAMAAFVLAVIAAFVQQRGEAAAAPHPQDVRMELANVKFIPSSLTVDAGLVTFAVHNSDLFWHTFTVEGVFNVDTPIEGRRRITVDLKPGTYEYICRVPGHTQAGMKGTLTVR